MSVNHLTERVAVFVDRERKSNDGGSRRQHEDRSDFHGEDERSETGLNAP
jgi:hypothetical protein